MSEQPPLSAYVPQIIRRRDPDGAAFVTFAMYCEACAICKRLMYVDSDAYRTSMAPLQLGITIREQAQRAGMVPHGSAEDARGRDICAECQAAGLARFRCWLCRQERTTDQLQERFGDPQERTPDYLCTVCYQSVSAARWEQAVAELEKEHRYDYE